METLFTNIDPADGLTALLGKVEAPRPELPCTLCALVCRWWATEKHSEALVGVAYGRLATRGRCCSSASRSK